MTVKEEEESKVDETTPDTAVLFDEPKIPVVGVSTDNHEVMIAEATAAAIVAAAVGQVDVSAAENAAALDAATAATLIDAAEVPMSVPDDTITPVVTVDTNNAKKNENRRKRYREKTFDEIEAEFPDNGDDISMTSSQKKKGGVGNHEDLLAARRMKDRQRYATMTPEQRQAYNAKRREQYHRQSDLSRQRRRERERARYHALQTEEAKIRNERRAKLERERYQKLSPELLEAKNRRRRERALLNRQKKEAEKAAAQVDNAALPTPPVTVVAETSISPPLASEVVVKHEDDLDAIVASVDDEILTSETADV